MDQLFADVPTDKTSAAKDEYFLNHGVILPFCRLGAQCVFGKARERDTASRRSGQAGSAAA
jgi:hypothetical protein